jgi:hypothetical protein
VRGLIVFLEDRRALYQDHHREFTPHVIESVFQIREKINETLPTVSENGTASESLRAMRAACRRFLDIDQRSGSSFSYGLGSGSEWLALGELRAAFGIHIARLCAAYGIDVEPQLEVILPPEDVDDG